MSGEARPVAGRRKRVGRPPNAIRQNHFDSLQDGAWSCKYCTQTYKKSTASGNLTKHILNNHKDKVGEEELNSYYRDTVSIPSNMMNMGYNANSPQMHTYRQSAYSPDYINSVSTTGSNSVQLSPGSESPGSNYGMPSSPDYPVYYSLDPVNPVNPATVSYENFGQQQQQSLSFQPNSVVNDVSMSVLQNTFSLISPHNYSSQQNANTDYMEMEGMLPGCMISVDDITLSSNALLEAVMAPVSEVVPTQASTVDISTQEGVGNSWQQVANTAATTIPTILDGQSRKRRHEIHKPANIVSLYEIRTIVNDMTDHAIGKKDIQEFVENAILDSPILLNAFMKQQLDALSMINSRFGKISLSLFGDGLIGERKDAMKTIVFEKINKRWDPCLFQVYIFPFRMRGKTYCSVELGFQNVNSQRRSCILDCIEIPAEAHDTFVSGNILRLLDEFGVRNKLSDVAIKGNLLQKDLTDILVREVKVKDQRQKIKTNPDNPRNIKRIKEYFAVPGIHFADEVYKLQMNLANFDSLVCSVKQLDEPARSLADRHLNEQQMVENHIPKITNYNGANAERAKWFKGRYEDRVRLLGHHSRKLLIAAEDIGGKLFQISTDQKNHVYYLPTNSRERINLLRLVPIVSYQKQLQVVIRLLHGFVDFLERYLATGDALPSSVDDLTEQMGSMLIEFECKQGVSEEQNQHLTFDQISDWDSIYKQGIQIGCRYDDICQYLEDMSPSFNSGESSFYVDELIKISSYAPPTMSFDKFKKISFLKAWKTFEINYS